MSSPLKTNRKPAPASPAFTSPMPAIFFHHFLRAVLCWAAVVFSLPAFAQQPANVPASQSPSTRAPSREIPSPASTARGASRPQGSTSSASNTPPASIAPPSAPPRAAAPGYVLSPGDTVLISVFDEPGLEAQKTIGTSGEISLHLIGAVQVGGKTVSAAEKHIKELYFDREILVNPRVTLTLASYAEHFVTVSGAVATPCRVPIPQEGRFDVLAAIAAAGGATEKADLRRVVLRTSNGAQTNPPPGRELKSGDSLIVPQKVEEWVNVRGEVNRPAPVKVPDTGRIDVLTAITIAGDYSKFAQPKNITVRRNGRIIQLDGAAMANGSAPLYELLPGDTLTVGRRRF